MLSILTMSMPQPWSLTETWTPDTTLPAVTELLLEFISKFYATRVPDVADVKHRAISHILIILKSSEHEKIKHSDPNL